jgi:hypothetical protein
MLKRVEFVLIQRVGDVLTVRYTVFFLASSLLSPTLCCFSCLTFGSRGCMQCRRDVRNSYEQDRQSTYNIMRRVPVTSVTIENR